MHAAATDLLVRKERENASLEILKGDFATGAGILERRKDGEMMVRVVMIYRP
jgi:hypothetical protein